MDLWVAVRMVVLKLLLAMPPTIGAAIRRIWLRLLFVIVVATVITYLHEHYGYFEPGLTTTPFTLVALAVFVVRDQVLWIPGLTLAIGSMVGLIPGVGSAVACFVAYGSSKAKSKNKDEWGKGAIEGVAA